MRQSGFSLIELLIVLAILLVAGGVIVAVNRDFFSFNRFFEESSFAQRDLETVIRAITSELRAAVPASTGAYPLQIVAPTAVSFFTNTDSDNLKERVHYFVSGTELKKSVVKPGGSPLTYATTTATEEMRTVLRDLAATTTPLFLYYDTNYGGTTTPLADPVNVLNVRLVHVSLTVDRNPFTPPPPLTVTSEVSIRNLKDNY